MKIRLLTIVVLSANLLTGCADDQARTQIADTQVKLSQLQNDVNLLSTKSSNSGQLDLLNRLDDLQEQINQLNHSVDDLKHNFSTSQQTQDQINQGVQKQIGGGSVLSVSTNSKSNASGSVVAATAVAAGVARGSVASNIDDKNLNSAIVQIRQKNYNGAIKKLNSIVAKSSNTQVVTKAKYYLVVAYAASGQYKSAINAGNNFVKENPDDPHAGNALQVVYISQKSLGMNKLAQVTLDQIQQKYPSAIVNK